jgi:cytochrome c oxidase assembly factor CtaG
MHSSSPPLGFTLALLVVLWVYSRGWLRWRHALPTRVPAWRLAAFISGVFALWAVVGSPLAFLDHELLTVHMVQHLVLMTVAAPLILLGAPAITLLCGLPHRFVGTLLRWPPAQDGAGPWVTHPIFCWLASTATVIGWHLPPLFELGLQSGAWHRFEQASFFAAGILFWWPVVQPWPSTPQWPRSAIPLYLFLATLPCDALSAFLTFCNRVVYSHYLMAHHPFGISALEDQEFAGVLMWVCVTFAYLIPAAVVTVQLLSPKSRPLNTEVL